MSLKAVVLCACVAIAALASASAKPSTSGKAEGCNIYGQFVAVGESIPAKNSCEEYKCLGGGGISGHDCGTMGIPLALQKKCHFVVYKERPYPGCCPTVVCNE